MSLKSMEYLQLALNQSVLKIVTLLNFVFTFKFCENTKIMTQEHLIADFMKQKQPVLHKYSLISLTLCTNCFKLIYIFSHLSVTWKKKWTKQMLCVSGIKINLNYMWPAAFCINLDITTFKLEN